MHISCDVSTINAPEGTKDQGPENPTNPTMCKKTHL